MSQSHTFQFQVVLLHEAGQWVAQCLNPDVAEQGATIREAKGNLAKALSAHIVLALQNNQEPFSGLSPAPVEYWARFRDGQRLTDQEPVFVPPAFMVNAMATDLRVSA